jgi:hypothetical protein
MATKPNKSLQRMTEDNNQRPLSHYVALAESGREEGNELSDTKREAMVREALALIHGRDKDKTTVKRST